MPTEQLVFLKGVDKHLASKELRLIMAHIREWVHCPGSVGMGFKVGCFCFGFLSVPKQRLGPRPGFYVCKLETQTLGLARGVYVPITPGPWSGCLLQCL